VLVKQELCVRTAGLLYFRKTRTSVRSYCHLRRGCHSDVNRDDDGDVSRKSSKAPLAKSVRDEGQTFVLACLENVHLCVIATRCFDTKHRVHHCLLDWIRAVFEP